MGSDLFYPQGTGPITDRLYAIRDRDTNLFLYSDGASTLCIDAGYINNGYLKSEFEQAGHYITVGGASLCPAPGA